MTSSQHFCKSANKKEIRTRAQAEMSNLHHVTCNLLIRENGSVAGNITSKGINIKDINKGYRIDVRRIKYCKHQQKSKTKRTKEINKEKALHINEKDDCAC